MKKYFFVFKNSLSEYFAYRLNFILWRLRVVITVLISFFLWQAIFFSNKTIFGYKESQILTYMILITLLNGIVMSTQTHKVAYEINSGALSKFLLTPINFFIFNLLRDVTDKVVNIFFAMVEIPLLIILLRPPLYLQYNPYWLVLFLLASFLASFLYFEISMILSFIGFWSKETWAPRFIFYILLMFLAGTYFPLDILPPFLYQLLQLLPFTYLVFFPLKIYLGSIDQFFLVKGFILTSLWIFTLWIVMKVLWKKGLKIYTAEGS